MPTYEYVCTECGARTEVRATVSEKEKGLTVTCPQCGSQKMTQVFGEFMMIGSSKGQTSPSCCGSISGSSCCG